MAAWAAVTTDRFAAAVACSCISDWFTYHLTSNVSRFDELFLGGETFADPAGLYRQRSPVFNVRHLTPTLIIHGELDLCTPPGQGLELYRALVAARVGGGVRRGIHARAIGASSATIGSTIGPASGTGSTRT